MYVEKVEEYVDLPPYMFETISNFTKFCIMFFISAIVLHQNLTVFRKFLFLLFGISQNLLKKELQWDVPVGIYLLKVNN